MKEFVLVMPPSMANTVSLIFTERRDGREVYKEDGSGLQGGRTAEIWKKIGVFHRIGKGVI